MKKLLALILCVMMLVSIVPTSAFADDPDVPAVQVSSGKFNPKWQKTNVAKDAVEGASKTIENLYAGIAANNAVFGTVQSIDNVIVSLAKAMFADVDTFKYGVDDKGNALEWTGSEGTDATKAYLRAVIGDEIMNYLNKHDFAFANYTKVLDDDGNQIGTIRTVDPVKYLNTFAAAAADAVTSEKAQKNLEALMYTLAVNKLYDDYSDEMDDLWDAVDLWADGDARLGVDGYFFYAPMYDADKQDFVRNSNGDIINNYSVFNGSGRVTDPGDSADFANYANDWGFFLTGS